MLRALDGEVLTELLRGAEAEGSRLRQPASEKFAGLGGSPPALRGTRDFGPGQRCAAPAGSREARDHEQACGEILAPRPRQEIKDDQQRPPGARVAQRARPPTREESGHPAVMMMRSNV